tara:strand:+ start:37 stop:375 length:339 start_codon:yes stop_codon:yes gene_type:complete
MTDELSSLIENYKREIWEWKQKESQWIKDQNLLEGNKRIIEELSSKVVEMGERIKRLDESLANALEINESHQRYNGKLQIRLTEVTEDNKKLSKQIQDYIKNHEDKFRKAGL